MHNLCLPISFFQSCTRAKVTWMHPRSRRWHQLDHIVVRRKDLKSVLQCRSMHSADCDSDHALVRCKFRMAPKIVHCTRPSPLPAINTIATKDSSKVLLFRNLLSEEFQATSSPARDPSAQWTRFSSTVSSCAREVFG